MGWLAYLISYLHDRRVARQEQADGRRRKRWLGGAQQADRPPRVVGRAG